MKLNIFITAKGSYLANTGNRYFFLSPEDKKVRRETDEGEFKFLAERCKQRVVNFSIEELYFFENKFTTLNGFDAIRQFTSECLKVLLEQPIGKTTISIRFSEEDDADPEYIIFDEVEEDTIKGFYYDHTTFGDNHGVIIINKADIEKELERKPKRITRSRENARGERKK